MSKTNIINTLNKFKYVYGELVYYFDLKYEDIAAFNILINLLITRNNKYKSMQEFNKFLQTNYCMSIYARHFNRGNIACIKIGFKVMESRYAMNEDLLTLAFDTLYDCLYNPCFSIAALEEVKQLYLGKLKNKNNQKSAKLKNKISEYLGVDSPYGVAMESSEETINKVTLEDIDRVYQKLINLDAKLYCAGNINDINRYADKFKLKDTKINIKLDYLKEFNDFERLEFEEEIAQPIVSIMYKNDILYNDSLIYAFKTFIELLNYDLFNIIREKYNYCYYIYAFSNDYLNVFQIVSEIEYKNLDDVIRLVNEIINSYNNLSKSKLDLIINKIINDIDLENDNLYSLICYKNSFDFLGKDFDLETLKKSYLNVSASDIKKVIELISMKKVFVLKGNE